MKKYTSDFILYMPDFFEDDEFGFILFPEQHHTIKQIHNSKNELKRHYNDAIIRIADEDDKDELFRNDIFIEKKRLGWYLIEESNDVLRKQRTQGTSPVEYFINVILPQAEKLKQEYLASQMYKCNSLRVVRGF